MSVFMVSKLVMFVDRIEQSFLINQTDERRSAGKDLLIVVILLGYYTYRTLGFRLGISDVAYCNSASPADHGGQGRRVGKLILHAAQFFCWHSKLLYVPR